MKLLIERLVDNDTKIYIYIYFKNKYKTYQNEILSSTENDYFLKINITIYIYLERT